MIPLVATVILLSQELIQAARDTLTPVNTMGAAGVVLGAAWALFRRRPTILMLQALGMYRANEAPLDPRARGANDYTPDVIAAVDAFRASEKLGGPAVGSPSGLVDPETVSHLWAALERAGKARSVREQLLDVTLVRR